MSASASLKDDFFGGVPPQLSGFVCVFHPAAQVRAPSTPTTLLSIYIDLWLVGKDENEAGIGPFLLKRRILIRHVSYLHVHPIRTLVFLVLLSQCTY